jgi:molybdopterin-guanine dinucleotide biosynthesis protein A
MFMYKELEQIAPVILSGGKSSRMGSNKAFVTLGNEKLIEIVVRKISALFTIRPLLVTNTPTEYAYLGLPMVGDIIPEMGPLGGIHAALRHSTARRIFVFGCDMPFISAELVGHMGALAGGVDVVMPRHDSGRPEPLHAIYSQSCLGAI